MASSPISSATSTCTSAHTHTLDARALNGLWSHAHDRSDANRRARQHLKLDGTGQEPGKHDFMTMAAGTRQTADTRG
eukprot:3339309-Pleurochrysis_carterae.AAC.1